MRIISGIFAILFFICIFWLIYLIKSELSRKKDIQNEKMFCEEFGLKRDVRNIEEEKRNSTDLRILALILITAILMFLHNAINAFRGAL